MKAPGAQGCGVEDGVAQKEPAGAEQAVATQDVAPAELVLPAGQGVQEVAFETALNVPGWQSCEEPMGAGQYDPAGEEHGGAATQLVEPGAVVVVPAGHALQETDACVGEKVPMAHSEQEVWPTAAE